MPKDLCVQCRNPMPLGKRAPYPEPREPPAVPEVVTPENMKAFLEEIRIAYVEDVGKCYAINKDQQVVITHQHEVQHALKKRWRRVFLFGFLLATALCFAARLAGAL